MSRIKLLIDVIEDIRALGDSLQVLADAMASNEPREDANKESKAMAEQKVEEQKADAPVSEKKAVTLEEVRKVLAEKSRAGFTDDVKAILNKHGGEKLSEVDPTEYKALLAEAEVIGNA